MFLYIIRTCEVVKLRKYSDTKTNKILHIILIVAVLLSIIICLFYKQLNKHMSKICEYKGRETANHIISEAINKQLTGSEKQNYINIERDEYGKIISIETDSKLINKLQTELKESINNNLIDIENNKISIPIGTMSGITFLSGRGPDINLRLHQIGAADSEILSEFISAGINQTKHRLVLRVTVELSAILPAHSTDITVKNDYVISETIIVGDIPNGYIGTYKV